MLLVFTMSDVEIYFVLQHDCCTDDLAVEACVPDIGAVDMYIS